MRVICEMNLLNDKKGSGYLIDNTNRSCAICTYDVISNVRCCQISYVILIFFFDFFADASCMHL